MKFLFIILSVFFTEQCYGQIMLEYSELNIRFIPKKANDTLTFNIKEKTAKVCTIYLQDIKGQCDFVIKDMSNKLLVMGHYDNALDTSKKYEFAKQRNAPPNEYVYSITQRLYFQPLKSGNWYYYDKKKSRKFDIRYITN